MPSAGAVLDQARLDIGYNGEGSCDAPISTFGEWWGIQTQWCAEAVSYWLYSTGMRNFAGWDERGDIYCPRWVAWLKDNGMWRDSSPQPGDIVFYAWVIGSGVADHVGLVESVEADGSIYAIEGNTDDRSLPGYGCGNTCRRKFRDRKYILGFGVPAYEGASVSRLTGHREMLVEPIPVGPFNGAFSLAPGHFYGDIDGPDNSHGGIDADEMAAVMKIQVRLQELGYAPNQPGWADGKFERPTVDAVAAWQRDHMPGTEFFGQVWSDDWAALFS